jgi:hypothetical protein
MTTQPPRKKGGRPKGSKTSKQKAIATALAKKTGAFSQLTPQERIAVNEFIRNGDIGKACRKAYPTSKWGAPDHEAFLNRPQVKLALEEHYEVASRTYLLALADVVEGLHAEATKETNTGRERIAAWDKLSEILGVGGGSSGSGGGGGKSQGGFSITINTYSKSDEGNVITVEREE